MTEITYFQNIHTNLIFICLDEENLINPMGKMIPLNEDLFEELDEACPEMMSLEQAAYMDFFDRKDKAEAANIETQEEKNLRITNRNIRERIEWAMYKGNFVNCSNLCMDWTMKEIHTAIDGKYELVAIDKITKDKNITPKTYICKIGECEKVLANFNHA